MSSSPDIFLSYNREDQATARLFAEALGQAGFDVWWDATLRSGEAYDEVTEKALRDAKAVVVLWSKKSVVSRRVRAEATLADRNRTLVPAMIESCERPIMFELTQTADLTRWNGDASDRLWQAFLADVRRFVGAGGSAPIQSTPQLVTMVPALHRQFFGLNGGSIILNLYHPYETPVRADPRFKDIVRRLGLVDYWRTSGKWPDCARPVGNDDLEFL